MKKEVIEIVVKGTGKGVKEVEKLDKSIKKTGKSGKNVTDGLNKGFATLPSGISGAINSLKAFKVALISTGVGAIVVALGAMVSLFAAAGSKGAEFGKAMSGVKAVLNGTDAEMKALSKSARELGSSTEYTAVQVAGLQTELAKLGFRTDDILNASAATLDLASSMGIGLSDAASFAGSTLRAFGLETTDTQRVVDVMAKSTATSALDFEALRESIKLAAPTARALNIPLEDTVSLLGILANNGLKGSIAGTGLSKSFIMLNQKGLTLNDAFEKIKNSSNKLNTSIELVGVVGSKSLLTLAENSEGIDTLTDSLLNAEGAAKLLAETRLDNLAGDTTKLGSAWEGFLLDIEDGEGIINKISRAVVQFTTETITFVGNLFTVLSANFSESTNTISSYWTITKSIFLAGVESIKIAFNNIGLAFSKVPFLGKAIDKEALQSNINAARDEIIRLKEEVDNATLDGDYQTRVLLRLTEFENRKNELTLKKNKELADAQKKIADEKWTEEQEAAFREFEKENNAIRKKIEAEEKEKQRIADKRIKDNEELQAYLDEEERIEMQSEDFRINNEYEASKKRKKIAKDELDAKVAMQFMLASQIGNALGNISQLFEQGTAASKAAALAEIVIGTGIGFIQGLDIAQKGAKAAGPAAPFAFPIFYATQIAAVLGAVGKAKNILSQVKGGSSSAGGSASAPQIPQAQSPDFNIVGGSDTNQLAGAIGQQEKKPIKAFMVSKDVSTAQEMDRNIIASASFG